MTNPNSQIYHGVDITATKRFSNRWQMQTALTLQVNPQHFPDGSATFINPTNRPFQEGISTIEPWLLFCFGYLTFSVLVVTLALLDNTASPASAARSRSDRDTSTLKWRRASSAP